MHYSSKAYRVKGMWSLIYPNFKYLSNNNTIVALIPPLILLLPPATVIGIASQFLPILLTFKTNGLAAFHILVHLHNLLLWGSTRQEWLRALGLRVRIGA